MKKFVEFLVQSLVKAPQNVVVDELHDGNSYRYSVSVDPADMGLIIGKGGRTINSIRLLAKAKAIKEGVWVDIQLLDNHPNGRTIENTQHQGQEQHNDNVEETQGF